MAEPLPVWTIGHSNRSIEEFVALLEESEIELVVDIRTVPRSRANPQFNPDRIEPSLSARGIDYGRIGGLGGLRGKSRTVPPEVNGLWRNASFHNYADHALTTDFRAALDELLALADARRCAIMCAEAVWWRCHRRIVGDYLIRAGIRVIHIMGPGKTVPATLTEGAVPTEAGIVYPATQSPAAPNASADDRP